MYIIYDIRKRNFSIKINEKNLHNPNNMPTRKQAINYCTIKYRKHLCGKFTSIFNNNNSNVKIALNTHNNSIKKL